MATDLRLTTKARLKAELEIADSDVGRDTLLDALLLDCSDVIEGYCRRHLISRGTLTEYHSIRENRSVIYLLQSPLLASPAIQIYEDFNGAFGADTLLVNGTDYFVDTATGRVERVSSNMPIPWAVGVRVVKAVYAGSYDDAANDKANIPRRLQDACLSYAAIAYREIERKSQGVVELMTAAGSKSTYMQRNVSTAHIPEVVAEQLSEFVRVAAGIETGVAA